eukprot:gene19924-23839_t
MKTFQLDREFDISASKLFDVAIQPGNFFCEYQAILGNSDVRVSEWTPSNEAGKEDTLTRVAEYTVSLKLPAAVKSALGNVGAMRIIETMRCTAAAADGSRKITTLLQLTSPETAMINFKQESTWSLDAAAGGSVVGIAAELEVLAGAPWGLKGSLEGLMVSENKQASYGSKRGGVMVGVAQSGLIRLQAIVSDLIANNTAANNPRTPTPQSAESRGLEGAADAPGSDAAADQAPTAPSGEETSSGKVGSQERDGYSDSTELNVTKSEDMKSMSPGPGQSPAIHRGQSAEVAETYANSAAVAELKRSELERRHSGASTFATPEACRNVNAESAPTSAILPSQMRLRKRSLDIGAVFGSSYGPECSSATPQKKRVTGEAVPRPLEGGGAAAEARRGRPAAPHPFSQGCNAMHCATALHGLAVFVLGPLLMKENAVDFLPFVKLVLLSFAGFTLAAFLLVEFSRRVDASTLAEVGHAELTPQQHQALARRRTSFTATTASELLASTPRSEGRGLLSPRRAEAFEDDAAISEPEEPQPPIATELLGLISSEVQLLGLQLKGHAAES